MNIQRLRQTINLIVKNMSVNDYLFAAFSAFIFSVIVFFPTFVNLKLPIATDILTGQHYPWVETHFPGLQFPFPVKNMESFDAVREMFPWRYLVIEQYKSGHWPLWNPAQLSGSPLAANFLAAPFYPLNIIFLVLPFSIGWGVLAILQVYLAFLFTYLLLRSYNLTRSASIFGSIVFSLSGFMAGFFHSNIMDHALLWTPLALFSVNQLSEKLNSKWIALLAISIAMIGLASFLQIFLYSVILIFIYLIFKSHIAKDRKFLMLGLVGIFFGILATSIQLIPSIEMLLNSSRLTNFGGNIDDLLSPIHHMLLFFAPDYFGNPGKWNYFGSPSYYHEYSFYVGIATLCLSFIALGILKTNKILLFWITVFVVTIVLAVENPISRIPLDLKLPLLASITPSRAYAYTDLSLAILSAFGINILITNKKLKVSKAFFLFMLVSIICFLMLILNSTKPGLFFSKYLFDNPTYRAISVRNLIIPFSVFILSSGLIFVVYKVKKQKIRFVLIALLSLLTMADLVRQFRFQNGFVENESVFPETKITEFLRSKKISPRIISIDDSILTPNIGAYYGWENIDGYQPERSKLYEEAFAIYDALPSTDKKRFGKIISIVEPKSQVIDLLGVDYVFSRYPLEKVTNDKNYKLIIEEGGVYGYENKNSVPRFHLLNEDLTNKSDLDYLTNNKIIYTGSETSSIEILNYEANSFKLKVKNSKEAQILQTMVINYPGWEVVVDNQKTKLAITQNNFIGVNVPKGESIVEFRYRPMSFIWGLTLTLISLMAVIIVCSKNSSEDRNLV